MMEICIRTTSERFNANKALGQRLANEAEEADGFHFISFTARQEGAERVLCWRLDTGGQRNG